MSTLTQFDPSQKSFHERNTLCTEGRVKKNNKSSLKPQGGGLKLTSLVNGCKKEKSKGFKPLYISYFLKTQIVIQGNIEKQAPGILIGRTHSLFENFYSKLSLGYRSSSFEAAIAIKCLKYIT